MYLFVLVISSLTFQAQKDNSKLDLLVIINADNKPEVNLNNSPVLFLGVAGVLVSEAINDASNAKNSKKLQEILVGFESYKVKHATLIKDNLLKNNSKLNITVFNRSEASKYYDSDLKLNFDSLKKDGWKNILLIDETIGYLRIDKKKDLFNLSIGATVQVYDINEKKSIYKEALPVNDISKKFTIDDILSNKNLLLDNYESLYPKLDYNLYFGLLRKDVFSKMAKIQGVESNFPSFKDALKEYEGKFDYNHFIPDGWKKFDTKNHYLKVSAPKSDKSIIAITTDVDLAIQEFGQGGLDIEEYIALRISRMREIGLDVDSITEAPEMNVGEGWKIYSIKHPVKGRSILLNKKVNNEYFINHEIALLNDDYLQLFAKHKAEIEKLIANSVLIVK